jgi:hypothetical protein
MAEDRIGAITQQSIEAIVVLNSDETQPHFQTSCSAKCTLALLPPGDAEAPNRGHPDRNGRPVAR